MAGCLLPLLAQWILVSNHNHSEASPDSSLRLADLAYMAQDAGIQAVVVTDHNTVRSVLEPAFQASSSVVFIAGEEWGSWNASKFWGHVGLIGLKGNDDIDPLIDPDRMFDHAKSRGALAVVNHPFNWLLGWRGEEIPVGAGGIEVWNQGWNSFAMNNARALSWWDAALRKGRRLVAVGGADVHGIHTGRKPVTSFGIDFPINLVWADSPTVSAIMAGFHAGRVVIARDASAPKIELWAKYDNKTAMIGEALPADGTVKVQVVIKGGKGKVLSLISNSGPVHRSSVDSNEETISREITVDGQRGGFVRAELREPWGWPEAEVVVLTNPVYFVAKDPRVGTFVPHKPETILQSTATSPVVPNNL